MKFSIRDLLLVTMIVALAVGWWVDHWQWAIKFEPLIKAQKEADERFTTLRDMIESDGSKVGWRSDKGELRMWIDFPEPRPVPNSSAPAPNPPKK
jgi:hypothetical protein